jgi:hypothetical protein
LLTVAQAAQDLESRLTGELLLLRRHASLRGKHHRLLAGRAQRVRDEVEVAGEVRQGGEQGRQLSVAKDLAQILVGDLREFLRLPVRQIAHRPSTTAPIPPLESESDIIYPALIRQGWAGAAACRGGCGRRATARAGRPRAPGDWPCYGTGAEFR